MIKDLKWKISVGMRSGTISGPDPIEAATRFLEKLYRDKEDFGVGLLIKAVLVGKMDSDTYYLRSDIVLANAGMYKEAEQMLSLYLKKKPSPGI